MRHNPEEALVEQGPDQAEELFFWEMVLAKDRASLEIVGLGQGRRECSDLLQFHFAGESQSYREQGESWRGRRCAGTSRALQRLAVLAVVASPAPTLLGAALGALLPPAPHPQVGLAMQMHSWVLGGSLF